MANREVPISPVEESVPPNPPGPIEDQREMFFPTRPFRFYPVDLGLAFGIAAALFMFFYTIITLAVNKLGSATASLVFFEQIFPGFHLGSTLSTFILGTFVGLIWSFVLGFVLGTLIGFVYNLRLKRYVVSL